jgi:hypothetical protein
MAWRCGAADFPAVANLRRKNMSYYIKPAAYAVAAVVLLGSLAVATTSRADAVDQARLIAGGTAPSSLILAQGTSTQAPSTAAPSTMAPSGAAVTPMNSRIEVRIKDLHTKLKITKDQEELWKAVADAMRENADRMEQIVRARAATAKTINAVDDLKSYAEIADAHSEGLKKFIPAFEALYNSMSDAQKKHADVLFRARIREKTK